MVVGEATATVEMAATATVEVAATATVEMAAAGGEGERVCGRRRHERVRRCAARSGGRRAAPRVSAFAVHSGACSARRMA